MWIPKEHSPGPALGALHLTWQTLGSSDVTRGRKSEEFTERFHSYGSRLREDAIAREWLNVCCDGLVKQVSEARIFREQRTLRMRPQRPEPSDHPRLPASLIFCAC